MPFFRGFSATTFYKSLVLSGDWGLPSSLRLLRWEVSLLRLLMLLFLLLLPWLAGWGVGFPVILVCCNSAPVWLPLDWKMLFGEAGSGMALKITGKLSLF